MSKINSEVLSSMGNCGLNISENCIISERPNCPTHGYDYLHEECHCKLESEGGNYLKRAI
jgi:hypothetical protein